MKKNTIIASVVAAFAATAASAGSLVVPVADPVIVVAPTPADSLWDGFYAGATFGWNTGDTQFLTATSAPFSRAFDGLTYGGFIGYNYVMDGGFMLGAELAGTVINMDGPPDFVSTVFDAKLRAGVEMDRALVYVSGGYSMLWDDASNEGTGWNVGAGIDYLVTDSIFVGAEYVYRDITDSLVTPAAWQDQFHTFQIRAGIKF